MKVLVSLIFSFNSKNTRPFFGSANRLLLLGMAVGEKRFHESLNQGVCPPEFNVLQQALWHDGKGDWDTAHDLINDLTSPEAAWVHAYLHRKEGDLGNANYWYCRAGKSRGQQSLLDEWQSLVRHFCAGH
jgi:hypothetical protein